MPITFEDTKLPDTELFRQVFELSYAEMIAKHKESSLLSNKEDSDTEYADNNYKFYIRMIDHIQNSGTPVSDHELAAILLAPAIKRRPELVNVLDSETALAVEQEGERTKRFKAAATAEGLSSAIKTPAENVIARVYLIEEMHVLAHLCGTGVVLSDLYVSDPAIDMAGVVDGMFEEYDRNYGILKDQVSSPYLDEKYKEAVENLRSLISIDIAVNPDTPASGSRANVRTPKNDI